ncbi:MAG: hemerythrin family protein [Betaproteobacteria bacterium]
MDLQHQTLISLCNKVSTCLAGGASKSSESFQSLLCDLVTLATEHFRTEEIYLEQNNCPTYAEHRAEHDSYLETLVNLLFDATGGVVDINRAYEVSAEWLVHHVMDTDLGCKEYYRAA